LGRNRWSHDFGYFSRDFDVGQSLIGSQIVQWDLSLEHNKSCREPTGHTEKFSTIVFAILLPTSGV